MSLEDTMKALEKAGSAQTRKTYARHGVTGPMFGVSFATLKTLYKQIRVDQKLAEALWGTKNFDALNLAVKIADPASISSRELDRWAATPTARMCGAYVAHVAAESPHGRAKADKWLAASDDTTRSAGWALVAAMAMIDESTAACPGSHHIEPEIDAHGLVRQAADADAIDTGFCERADGVEAHTAGGFEQDVVSRFVAQADGLAEHRRGHVVQQDDVGTCTAGGEKRAELVEGIDFDLGEAEAAAFSPLPPAAVLGCGFACSIDRCVHNRGETIWRNARDVVVLDEQGIVQADAVAEAAAAADSILLEHAHAGCGLAGVEEARRQTIELGDKLGGACRDA